MASSPPERVTPHALALAQKALAGRIVDRADMLLAVAWTRAWDRLATDLNKLLADATRPGVDRLRRQRRLREALRLASVELERLAVTAGVQISDDALVLIRQAIADTNGLLAVQSPLSMTFNTPDPQQMQAIVERTTSQVHKATYRLTQDAEVAMKRALSAGVAAGEHPEQAARRMVTDTRGAFNGGMHRARVLARTEMLDAYRAAAAETRRANADLVSGWQWIASLSSRTCPACWAMHGTIHPLTEDGPNDHHAGRCTAVPVLKPMEGVDDPAPIGAPDPAVAFGRLTEAEQLRVLGPTRFEAWQAGDYPISAWVMDRHNPGWRDSIATAPVPSSTAAVA